MATILTRDHLLSTGWTSDRITAAVRDLKLIRLAKGVYCFPTAEEEWQWYRTTVLAVARNWGGVVSHLSAAALHDIPCLRPDRSVVHFTVDRASGGCVRGNVHVHVRALRPEDITVVDGVLVTTPARTASDLALTGDLERGVCAFDAVRLIPRFPKLGAPPPVPHEELADSLAHLGRRRGAAQGRRALESSVTCSESPGESLSRIQMVSWRIPAPQLQAAHVVEGCQYFVDFEWGCLIGEFDGHGKYGDGAEDQEEAFLREKDRQNALEAAGFEVVRWGWRVLNTPGRLHELLAPKLERHGYRAAA